MRAETRSFVELLALCGFAIAQPLLDVFGRAPEQFVFRGATHRDIVLFATVVTLGPPIALWLVEALVGVTSTRVRRVVHLLLVAALVAAFAMQALRPLTTGFALVVISVAAGAVAVVLHARIATVRMWLSFASVAPVAFVALFLLTSATARLLETPRALAVDGGADDPAPVVMLMLDELPLVTLMGADGTIDEELFPNIAALAETSHWYRRATSVSSTTMHAVPAMLSGMLPAGNASPAAIDHPNNLFTLLDATSYELDVAESITRLCPTEMCTTPNIDAQGLGGLLRDAQDVLEARISPSGNATEITETLVEPDDTEPRSSEVDAAFNIFHDTELDQPARFDAMVDQITDDRPALHYAHLLLPHQPWRHLPDGRTYKTFPQGHGRDLDTWTADTPQLVELARQRHLLQTMYVDALVGDLLDTLARRGLLDDVLLVVTADHGIAFTPGEAVRATVGGEQQPLEVAAQLMYVPFFVKLPGQSDGAVHDQNTWAVDLLPTIADVLAIDLPWEPDGRSVFATPRSDGATSFFLNTFDGIEAATGDRQIADADALWAAALGSTIDRTFPRSDRWRVWRSGPRPELVGVSMADPRMTRAQPLAPRWDPAISTDLEPDDPAAPVLVRGNVDGQVGDAIAVAVNGTVASTATLLAGGSFVVLVDPSLYRPGSNVVEVVQIAPDP